MNLEETLTRINKDREKVEAAFVFSLWKDPELFGDYLTINDGKVKTLRNKDAQFYFDLGKALYLQGYRNFDSITVESYLSDKSSTKKQFETYGGYGEVKQLMGLIDTDNIDGYYDAITKKNTLCAIAAKCDELFDDVSRFDKATNEDIYATFDLMLNEVSLATHSDTKIENLLIDDEFIDECQSGMAVGLDYSENCPILNYITMGMPLGDMYMLAGHSGIGKSSFVFENFVLPLTHKGIKCAIISNEMRSRDYKFLLLAHVLTKELDYWELTRKKMKKGGMTQEQLNKMYEAKDIIERKYASISFVKLFENNINSVTKYIRKLAHQGYQMIVWDTMKSDDEVDPIMWQMLLMNSRRVFNLASKLNINITTTFQLSLATQNQRFLDAGCLSNSKQVKEVFSEMVYLRLLWPDEYTGERYDVKPFKLTKTDTGATIKTFIDLDKEKKYIIAFVDKTRNDEDKQQVLYEFNGRYNKWREIARCTVINEHRS